jgi:hypothetical protein
MKNADKITKAEEVLAHARFLGFENAFLSFMDEDGQIYDNLEELSESYGGDEEISASIILTLDEELSFRLREDPEDETAEPRIDYTR